MTQQQRQQDDDPRDRFTIRRWDRSPQAIHRDLLAGQAHPAARTPGDTQSSSRTDRLQPGRAIEGSIPGIRLPAQAGHSTGTMIDIEAPLDDVLAHDLDHTVDLLAPDR